MLLWFRALLYMLLIGGGWLLLLPLTIIYVEQRNLQLLWWSKVFFTFGFVSFAFGAVIALIAGYQLITFGKGTPFPLDRTRKLVTSGPYRYVRNPQGIAMFFMTLGVVFLIRSAVLWIKLPLTLIYLECIIGPIEDRQLRRDFGDEYVGYKNRVRKWIPTIPSKIRS